MTGTPDSCSPQGKTSQRPEPSGDREPRPADRSAATPTDARRGVIRATGKAGRLASHGEAGAPESAGGTVSHLALAALGNSVHRCGLVKGAVRPLPPGVPPRAACDPWQEH